MNPDPATIALELCTYLRERVLDKSVAVEPSTLFSDVGVDSMSVIELVMYLERKHGIELPETALQRKHLESAQALADCACAVRNGTFVSNP
ncbi:MAG: acyl carrier protein [Flavobacteriales bacterium]|nr:MAG: acyl carrier protein [Flavobacteriales bacterium]